MHKTPFDELVAEVAGLAYPTLPPLEAKRKVRDRTDYARKQGHIMVTGNASVGLSADRIDFLRWAQGHWPEIANDLKLSNEMSMAATAPSPTLKSYLVSPPTDNEELSLAFVAQAALLHKTTAELVQCQAHNEALKNQLATLKRRKEVVRKKRSDAGKQGGRGNAK